MTTPERDEVIQAAKKVGIPYENINLLALGRLETGVEMLEHFASLAAAAESKRADALAVTIAALRDLVTTEGETKADFVHRVRAVLGEDPDARVVRAVLAEREACANVCDLLDAEVDKYPAACAAVIRARTQQ